MALRIIIRTDDASLAANIGGAVETQYRTFDVDLPEVEEFLSEPKSRKWAYAHRQVVGVEIKEPT